LRHDHNVYDPVIAGPFGGATENRRITHVRARDGNHPGPRQLEPYRPEETRVLAELHAEGVVKSLFRLSDRPGVYLIVEADDVEEARRQVGRLPFVSHGLLLFEFEPVEKLL